MGTVLQERIMHNDHNFTSYTNRANNKAARRPSSRRNTNPTSQNVKKDPQKGDHLATENGLQIRGRRPRSDRTSVTVTTTAIRQKDTISKSQVCSANGQMERRHRRNTRHLNEDKVLGKLKSLPPSLMCVPVQSQESAKSHSKNTMPEPRAEDTDSGSDLSEMERLPRPPSNPEPPQLHLREEVIDPSDFRPLHHLSRVPRDSYPDFLPPPFNSWCLRQLAVYLNTDASHRLKPVGQLDRYLERLLRLEWHQIQTIDEESGKSAWAGHHRPQATPQPSLSAPKSILQCQRAFPLALLSSLTNTPCNGACRLYAHPHHLHLPETCGRAPRLPRRSSSESRDQRLGDPLDSSSYLKHMLAVGNIRNPAGFNLQGVSDKMRKKGSGGRSRSCGDVSMDAYRRVCLERRTAAQHLTDSRAFGATSSKELDGKQKRVEFSVQ